MRIAVTYENGQIFQHFGHTETFKIYDVEEGKVLPLGSVARYLVACVMLPGPGFWGIPAGTLAVNAGGSLLIGCLLYTSWSFCNLRNASITDGSSASASALPHRAVFCS